MKKLISIMIPAYNEEESIPILYDRLNEILQTIKYDYEIFFINDGSKDRTLEIIKELHKKDNRISYLNLARNYGKEIAMAAGFDYVKGDAVIIMDADLQDPPPLIPEMIKYWEEGYDDVYCVRRSRKGESFLKKKSSELFYKLLQKLTRVNILANVGDFRLLSRRALNAMTHYREHKRYTKGFFSLVGLRKKEILFDRDPRIAGNTKWNYISLINLAIEGITSFTSAPLRVSTISGAIIALIGFLSIVYIVIYKLLFDGIVEGWSSLASIILFLGGIQLISIGVLGEYIGRIFDETKRRPLYFVDEYNGKSEYISKYKE